MAQFLRKVITSHVIGDAGEKRTSAKKDNFLQTAYLSHLLIESRLVRLWLEELGCQSGLCNQQKHRKSIGPTRPATTTAQTSIVHSFKHARFCDYSCGTFGIIPRTWRSSDIFGSYCHPHDVGDSPRLFQCHFKIQRGIKFVSCYLMSIGAPCMS